MVLRPGAVALPLPNRRASFHTHSPFWPATGAGDVTTGARFACASFDDSFNLNARSMASKVQLNSVLYSVAISSVQLLEHPSPSSRLSSSHSSSSVCIPSPQTVLHRSFPVDSIMHHMPQSTRYGASARQSFSSLLAFWEVKPGSQTVHVAVPLPGLYLPIAQAAHVLFPVYPGGHVQLDTLLLEG